MIRRRQLPAVRIAAIAMVVASALVIAAPASATEPRSNAERDFLVDMVSHHAMAVDMAEMAQEKATHPELKALAANITRSQTAEIRRMRRWLRIWYDRRVTVEMDHEDMRMLEQAPAGPQFEVLFMAMMSVHHAQAIERARAVRRFALHPQTRELTGDIIRSQGREISQMQEYLVAWYGN
jgi:uncharacterized protein (DUF305 family)